MKVKVKGFLRNGKQIRSFLRKQSNPRVRPLKLEPLSDANRMLLIKQQAEKFTRSQGFPSPTSAAGAVHDATHAELGKINKAYKNIFLGDKKKNILSSVPVEYRKKVSSSLGTKNYLTEIAAISAQGSDWSGGITPFEMGVNKSLPGRGKRLVSDAIVVGKLARERMSPNLKYVNNILMDSDYRKADQLQKVFNSLPDTKTISATKRTKKPKRIILNPTTGAVARFSKKVVEYRGTKFPGYNKPIESDRAGKKLMVLAKVGDKVKKVHFGDSSMSDYTLHKDKKRRKNYLTRSAGIRDKNGKPTMNNKMSANYWARRELW